MLRSTPVTTARRCAAATAALLAMGAAGCGADGEAAGGSAGTQQTPGSMTSEPPNTQAATATTSSEPAPTPTPTEVPYEGTGQWDYAPEASGPQGDGAPFAIAVRVEKGLPVDIDETAEFVMKTLRDKRGWQQLDGVAFELVKDEAQADALVSVASPQTTDQICAGLTTNGYTSCREGSQVAINANRWLGATEDFDNLTVYRQYVINHEVGHALGHDHKYCPAPGQPAPLMQQQTLGLQGCVVNPWPTVA